jgi:Ca2+-binding RTX toxin-like protein
VSGARRRRHSSSASTAATRCPATGAPTGLERAGSDVDRFARGDGQDVISQPGHGRCDPLRPGHPPRRRHRFAKPRRQPLILKLRDSDDRITIENALSGGRIESVRFHDGTEWSMATARSARHGLDDVITAMRRQHPARRLRNDILMARGRRHLPLHPRRRARHHRDGAVGAGDRLEISGYRASDIRFVSRAGGSNDVIIRFTDEGDEILIVDALDGEAGIETIFLVDDATSLTVENVRALLIGGETTGEDDVIVGTAGNDIIVGGRGSDLLVGGAGNDAYIYRRGDGDDRIDAFGTGQDELRLENYTVADVVSAVRAGPDSHDLIIRLAQAGDRIVLRDALGGANGSSTTSLKIVFARHDVGTAPSCAPRAVENGDIAGSDDKSTASTATTCSKPRRPDLMSGGAGSTPTASARGDGHDTVQDDSDLHRLQRPRSSSRLCFDRRRRWSVSAAAATPSSSASARPPRQRNGDRRARASTARGRKLQSSRTRSSGPRTPVRQLLDNRAPVAADDGYYSVTTGQPLTIRSADLLRNDFDADGDSLRIVAVDAGDKGVATLDAQGNVVFTATNGYYGPTSLRYTLSDGRNGFAQASVDIRVRPVATARDDLGFNVAEDGILTVRVERLLSNDLDGDRMVVSQVFGAVNGIAALSSDGNISFTPTPNFNGRAEFTYVANTPEGGRTEAKAFITVTPVNDAPVAVADGGFVTAEGTPILIDPRSLLANDRDIDGDALRLQSLVSTAEVQVTLRPDGMIEVRPRAYYWGNAHFNYVVADPQGATSTGRVNITVTPVNDVPEARNDRFDLTQAGEPIYEDNPIVISAARLLANDIEHDDEDVLRVTAVRNSHGGRARLLENNTVLFEPNADFNGDAWFEYQITDDQSGFSWARATIVYAPVNDRPVTRDDHYGHPSLYFLKGLEDNAIEIPIIELLKNDYDVEGFALRFESARDAIHGDIVITDRGTIIFTPDPDFWGEATFAYSVTDPDGAVNGAIVTLWFENVGDGPPVAGSDQIHVFEDVPTVIKLSTLLGNDTDIDRDPLRFVGFAPLRGLNGTLEFNADGDLLFTPWRNASSSSGFTYTITDDRDGSAQGFVDIVIIPSNDDPTVVFDEGFISPLDIPLVIRVSDVLFNDYDIEQVDGNGDGIIDVDLDEPNRARPRFVGIEAVLDPGQLALGNRVSVGQFEVVEFRGEQFIVVRFPAGFAGQVMIEYKIADAQGLTDVGFAAATVSDFYAGLLRGSARIDYVEGGALADTIRTFIGDDRVLGLGGDDIIETNAGADVIDGGDGDDWIDAGDGGDHVTGGAGFDTVTFAGSNIGVRADLESRVGQGGFAHGDTYVGIEALVGTDFRDQLYGDAADNRLVGQGGNDILDGRGGNDVLLGGEGHDTLTGGTGADILDGGAGSDTASYFSVDGTATAGVSISLAAGTATGGEAEGDTLLSIENLIGTDFADTLIGDGQANRLEGGRGDDVLDGGAGDDILIGGRGADTLIGGDGVDTVNYTASAQGVTIDLADSWAGSGDAQGDVLTGIEIVEGSYHDDIIRGDANDNRLRGGLGADVIDGRGGFDIADYSTAEDGVRVDLSTGRGLAGEALGDTLISIEMLIGSNWNDTFIGTSGSDTFKGGWGDDTLFGGAGSDRYLFGLDDDADVITDIGDAEDVDRLIFDALLLPKDVSLLRYGEDLFVEIEQVAGFLIDTIRIKDHFLGTATGIEEIVFSNGTTWDRARMDSLVRAGRFNAKNDVYRFGVEDEVVVIDPATLILNDAAEGVDQLTFVSVQKARFGSVTLRADGMIEFRGAPNHFGDAFFEYTVRDQFGRESAATVDVKLSPVNDAPIGVNDPLVYAVEDQVLRIRIDNLLANDYDVDGDGEFEELRIIGLEPLRNEAGDPLYPYKHEDYTEAATHFAWKIDGAYLELKPRPDYFGAAGFTYTIADRAGATAKGKVEIYVSPVNDAPRLGGPVRSVRLETTSTITVAELMAHVYDIEGDAFTFQGLHGGADANPTDNGTVVFDAAAQTLAYTPNALGEATIQFNVIDARGAAATLTYKLKVRPLNDAPIARNDFGLRTLEDQILVIDPATILANDSDENGDIILLTGVERFADNGKIRINEAGMIEFRPRADYNGAAGFQYFISDGRGGVASAYVSITVMPRNAGPVLRNDLVVGLEDKPLYVIPAEAFGNDLDTDGDVLFFKRSTVLGALTQKFLSPDFEVVAKLGNNRALPDWLSFDAATMSFSGTMPAGRTAPVEVAIFIRDPQNGATHPHRFSFTAGQLAAGTSVRDSVMEGYSIRQSFAVGMEFGAERLGNQVTATVALVDGTPLPEWLSFDPATLRFTGTPPLEATSPFDVAITFTYQGEGASAPVSFVEKVGIDPAQPQALSAGVGYDSDIALFDISRGSFSASLAGGRSLPDWLAFDTETMTLKLTGFAPDADAPLARLQIVFTPEMDALAERTFASSKQGFTLEFVIDPKLPLDPAINALLSNNPFFAAQGLFALDLGAAASIGAQRESRAPLPTWLSFDAERLSFAGMPPSSYVGAVPVRLDIGGNGSSLPSMSVITDVVVDRIFTVKADTEGLSGSTFAERINLFAPEDFNGSVGIEYHATDEKGGVSAKPAYIVFNVTPQAERPDAIADRIDTVENGSVTIAVTDLLDNDRDDDGDAIRVIAIGATSNGILTVNLATVSLAPPAALTPGEGATWSATLADGSGLPSWLAIDAATGRITALVPLDMLGALDIQVSATAGGTTASAMLRQAFDGNAGATISYQGNSAFSGRDSFTYTVTDDRQGAATGTVEVHVAPLFDPPTANQDRLLATEDTALVISPEALLANDIDVDGDPIRFLGVMNAVNGTISFDGTNILFVPTPTSRGRRASNMKSPTTITAPASAPSSSMSAPPTARRSPRPTSLRRSRTRRSSSPRRCCSPTTAISTATPSASFRSRAATTTAGSSSCPAGASSSCRTRTSPARSASPTSSPTGG